MGHEQRTLILLVVATAALAGTAGISAKQHATAREIMVSATIPESTAIFKVIDAPTTAEAWRALGAHAKQLAQAGEQLLHVAPGGDAKAWAEQVRLHLLAVRGIQGAIDRRNFDSMLEASEQLAETCANCHAKFMQQ